MPRRRARIQPSRRNITHFGGGLDTETPLGQVPPGRIRGGFNYEINTKGTYSDIQGYERFDGRLRPHTAGYIEVFRVVPGRLVSMEFDFGNMTLEEEPVRVSFTPPEPLAEPAYAWRLATDLTGGSLVSTPTDAESGAPVPIQVGSTYEMQNDDGTWSSLGSVAALGSGEASDQRLNAQLAAAAADALRSHIETPPGSGPVRGVFILEGVVYALRDNEDASAVKLHKATSGGWSEVDFSSTCKTVHFKGGLKTGGGADAPPVGGLTSITQAGTDYGAAELGVITVEKHSGEWAQGTAAGHILFTMPTSALAAGDATISATDFDASLEIDSALVSLESGGIFETVVGDIGQGDRVYGCDGVNRGFQFDGEQWLEVVTGLEDDTPDHLAFHELHLFFAFGRSAVHSGIRRPFDWSAIGGAAEFNMLNPITNFHIEPGESGNSAMSIWTTDRVSILYGTSAANWNLVPYRGEVGALAKTVQEVVYTVFMDEYGMRRLETVQSFGNFSHATFSEHIKRHFNRWFESSKPVGSCIVREKNQYRVFFDNGNAYYCTFRGERLSGIMPVNLDMSPSVVFSGEDGEGVERIFVGTRDGWVMELEKGTSFDGRNLTAYMRLHPDYMGARYQGVRKKFLSTIINASSEGYAEIRTTFGVRNERNIGNVAGGFVATALRSLSSWDDGQWDVSRWDAAGIGPERLKLNGRGDTINFTFLKDSNYFKPLEVNWLRTRFKVGRTER